MQIIFVMYSNVELLDKQGIPIDYYKEKPFFGEIT